MRLLLTLGVALGVVYLAEGGWPEPERLLRSARERLVELTRRIDPRPRAAPEMEPDPPAHPPGAAPRAEEDSPMRAVRLNADAAKRIRGRLDRVMGLVAGAER